MKLSATALAIAVWGSSRYPLCLNTVWIVVKQPCSSLHPDLMVDDRVLWSFDPTYQQMPVNNDDIKEQLYLFILFIKSFYRRPTSKLKIISRRE